MRRSVRRPLAVLLLALMALAVVVAGAIASGRVAFVGTHGVSMNPVYYQGDLVVVAKADSYRVGQIVAYRDPAEGIVVLHRIIGVNAAGFVMKGDNNQSTDPTTPTTRQVIGRAVLHIPHGGLWLDRLTGPPALALLAFALTAGGGTAVQTRRRRKRAAMSRHADHSRRPRNSVLALPGHLRTSAAATAAVGTVAIALGALAWTTPVTTLTHTATQSSQRMTFSYTATVARTAAYDTTSVHSPDPVFRRLADTVELHLAYRGNPGSISVSAELSTPGGWHSSVPLAQPTRFLGNAYDAAVRLDLKAIDGRAQAAAAVTGLPSGPVSIAVLPRISTPGQLPQTPALNLTLTPLQLSLTGAATNLIVQIPTTAARTTEVPRTLGLLGRHLTVSQARRASAILLLLALLAAGVLALIARSTAPSTEGAKIRRRYAPLLASVQPVTAPPHLPLIEVTEFATLAKLAERCGLLVLHWSRSHVDTFIVLDEGTTYRYRAGDKNADTAATIALPPLRVGDPTAAAVEEPRSQRLPRDCQH